VNLNQLKQEKYIKEGLKVEKIARPAIQKRQLQSALIHKYNQLFDVSKRVTWAAYQAEINSHGHREEANSQLMTGFMNKDVEEARIAELSLLVASKAALETCGFPCSPKVRMLAASSTDGVRIYSKPIADPTFLLGASDVFTFDQIFVASAWPSLEELRTWEQNERNFTTLRARAYGLAAPMKHGPQAPNLLPRWYKVVFDSAGHLGVEGYIPCEMQDNDKSRRYIPVLREVVDYTKPVCADVVLQECIFEDPDHTHCYAANLKKLWKPIKWDDRVLPWMTPILPKPPLTSAEHEQWETEQDLKFQGLLHMIFNFPIPLKGKAVKRVKDYETQYRKVMSPTYPFTRAAKQGLHDACEQPGVNCAWEEDTGRVAEKSGIKLDLNVPYYFPFRGMDKCKSFGDIEKNGEVCQNHPGAECLLYEETEDYSASTPTGSCRCGIQARNSADPGRVPKCPRSYSDLYETRRENNKKIALTIGYLAEEQERVGSMRNSGKSRSDSRVKKRHTM
jgi:hypothetical protein